MKRSRPHSLLALAAFGLVAPGLAAPASSSWPVSSAVFRLKIERAQNSPWPAAAGTVAVWPTEVESGRQHLGIFTASGLPVGMEVIWSSPGDPTTLLFDASSGDPTFYVYVSAAPLPAPSAWSARSGLWVETRPIRNLPADNWAEARRLLALAGPVSGRSLVPNIFLGANPHGPSVDYAALFNGFISVPRSGSWDFATASDDASFLFVDRRLVAQWPGKHDAGGGVFGQHHGAILLQKGMHAIEYVQIQYDGPSAAVAAWKGPGENRFEVIPPRAFLPPAKFHVTAVEWAPGRESAPPYFEWRNVAHCAWGGAALVETQFRVPNTPGRPRCHWIFDDGAEADGAAVRHCFARTGLRRVTLEAVGPGQRRAANRVAIRVEPHWTQNESWRDDVFARQKRELLSRDFSKMLDGDLREILRVAVGGDDGELLEKSAAVFLRRPGELASAQLPLLYDLGVQLQGRDGRADDLAGQALRRAQPLCSGDSAWAILVNTRLADFCLHISGELDRAGSLLKTLARYPLRADAQRRVQLLEGDLRLARGQTAEARQIFSAVRAVAPGPAIRPELWRQTRLASANDFIRRGQFGAAERILDEILSNQPLQRLSLEVQLPLIDIFLQRKEYQRTATACQRLRTVAESDPREASWLYAWTAAEMGLGRPAQAKEPFSKLLQLYPESDAAAEAKERWPQL